MNYESSRQKAMVLEEKSSCSTDHDAMLRSEIKKVGSYVSVCVSWPRAQRNL